MSFFNKYDKTILLVNQVLTINHNVDYGITVSNSSAELRDNKYSQNGLSIYTDLQKNNTLITISSKTLGAETARLISKETIKKIHQKVSKVVDISYDDFMQATVLKTEVTADVRYSEPAVLIESLYKLAKFQTSYKPAPKLYKSKKKACSFWMKKNNSIDRYIDFISIYDKPVEFSKQDSKSNQELLESLTLEELKEYMKQIEDIVRFEVKLNSAYMMRKHLELPKGAVVTLETLLDSTVQVVKNMVVRIFSDLAILKEKEFKAKNRAQLADYFSLKANDFDLERTLAFLQNTFGTIQRSREEKRLRLVLACVQAMQISSIALIYAELLKLL